MTEKGKELVSSGYEQMENGVVKGNSENAGSNNAGRVQETYNSLPSNKENSNRVKTVSSTTDLKELFNSMAEGGTLDNRSGKGVWIKLSDGTWIGYRTSSKSRGDTIDIKLPYAQAYKVHVREK